LVCTKFINPSSSSESSDYSGVFYFFGGEGSGYFFDVLVYFLPFYYFTAFSYLVTAYLFSYTLAIGYYLT
jgi:hypothetical protein